MQPHDWLWLLPVAASAYNAWLITKIQNAILQLNLDLSSKAAAMKEELIERIAKAEGDVRELRGAQARGNFPR